jgi:hypothetical protein
VRFPILPRRAAQRWGVFFFFFFFFCPGAGRGDWGVAKGGRDGKGTETAAADVGVR